MQIGLLSIEAPRVRPRKGNRRAKLRRPLLHPHLCPVSLEQHPEKGIRLRPGGASAAFENGGVVVPFLRRRDRLILLRPESRSTPSVCRLLQVLAQFLSSSRQSRDPLKDEDR